MRFFKKYSVIPLFLACGSVGAAEVDATYSPSTGELIIPHLQVGGQVFYVQLQQQGDTLTFKVVGPTLVNITPGNAGHTNDDDASLDGVWEVEDDGSTVTFIGNTYEIDSAPDVDECPNGGIESGTFTWEKSTGLVSYKVTFDANAGCGISDSGAIRMFQDGNVIYGIEGKNDTFTLIKM